MRAFEHTLTYVDAIRYSVTALGNARVGTISYTTILPSFFFVIWELTLISQTRSISDCHYH